MTNPNDATQQAHEAVVDEVFKVAPPVGVSTLSILGVPLPDIIYYNLFSDPTAMDICPISNNNAMWGMIAFALVCALVGYMIGFQVGSIEKEGHKW